VSDLPTFMDVFGFHLEHADEHEAVVRMDVPAALMSPFGQVIGGVIAALFDTGLAIAIARRLGGGDRIATHNLNVSYVAFTREQRLFCRSRVLSVGRSVAIAEGEVTSAAGDLVAKAVGTFGVRRLA
jgi:uncharacterized protein (TIGR00369 family)